MRIAAVTGAALTVLVLVTGCKVSVHAGSFTPGPIPAGPSSGDGSRRADSPYYQETLALVDVLRSDSAWSGALGADARAIRSDGREAGADAAQARSDARGDNTGCSAASNAANDAEDIHDLGTLGDDQATLAGTIDRVSRDLVQLRVDLSQLKQTGVRPPADTGGAIAGARARVARALTEANAGIRAINAAVVVAYAAANKVAKGFCSSESPGSPPPPYLLFSPSD